MALASGFLDELRARTTLSALIGRTVKISRAGREWKACCPFHNEKTPSFTINDDGKKGSGGFYHCFGCGAHGDAIRWLTDHRGLSFMDAVRELAAAAGMDVPAPDRSPEQVARSAAIDAGRSVLDRAAAIYAAALAEAGAIREYLFARGVDDAAIRRFGIGYARPGGALRGRGINSDAALAAGLLVRRDDGTLAERFRGRIMLPVHDARGRLCGFGARIAPGGKGDAKYVNSPASDLFDKGRLLFNLHRAAAWLRQPAGAVAPVDADDGGDPPILRRGLVVVEGYFDVIALDRVGHGGAVAPMGTALTPAQLDVLWRHDQRPLLAFDGDAAGRRAALRACQTALPMIAPGRSLAVAFWPAAMDPDDVVRAAPDTDAAHATVARVLAGAVPMHDFLFDMAAQAARESENVPTGGKLSPEAIAALWRDLADDAGRIGDAETRKNYLAGWRGKIDALIGAMLSTPTAVATVSGFSAAMWPDDGADDRLLAGAQAAGMAAMADGRVADMPDGDGGGRGGGDSAERLRGIIQSILADRAERAIITDTIRAKMAAAKAMGFHPAAITAVIRDIERDAGLREDFEAVWASYRRAMGVAGPLTDAVLPVISGDAMARVAAVAGKRMARIAAELDMPALPSAVRLSDAAGMPGGTGG